MSPNRLALPLSLLTLLAVPAAAAAQPFNDARNGAPTLAALPLTIHGTTAGATAERGEESSHCADDAGSVWYRINARHTFRVVARLQAGGDLDATLTVYRRLRSEQTFMTCDVSDTHGRAATGFTARAGQSYLVRVARRPDSVAGPFTLTLAPGPHTRLPGPPLPAGGVSGSLDRIAHRAQPWSVLLRSGTRYRMDLSRTGGACLTASLYAPGALKANRPPVHRLSCGHDYTLLTPHPGETGRFTIMINAGDDVRGPQRYHLEVAPAGRDDSAPGVLIGNYARVSGTLDDGGIDAVDMYRFNVTSTSKLFLGLKARRRNRFDLMLLNPSGRVLACSCSTTGDHYLVKGLHRGNYYIAVRAQNSSAGTYKLLRASRTITDTTMALAQTTLAAGAPQRYTVNLRPAVSGLVVISLEQYDPLAGWQFDRTIHVNAVDGVATVAAPPPTVGHWRAMARYEGTQSTAPSETAFHRFIVVNPLIGG